MNDSLAFFIASFVLLAATIALAVWFGFKLFENKRYNKKLSTPAVFLAIFILAAAGQIVYFLW